MEAVWRGDLKAVQEILSCDPSQSQIVTADGATPLMVAAMFGHCQIAQILLQYGAPIDAQDHRNGWTALMQAIYHRYDRIYFRYFKDGLWWQAKRIVPTYSLRVVRGDQKGWD